MELPSQTSSDDQVRTVQGLPKMKLTTWLESSQGLGEILHHTDPWGKPKHWLVSSFHQSFLEGWVVPHYTHSYSPRRQGALVAGPGCAPPSPQALCRNPRQGWQELTAPWGRASSQSSWSRVKPCSTMTLEGVPKSPKCTAETWSLIGFIRLGSTERRKGSHQSSLRTR